MALKFDPNAAGPVPGLQGDAAARKAAPIASGVLFYFPNALAAVANLSKVGNEQHNPGQPMHWAFDKSSDEADCIVRHLAQSGTIDTDGVPHSVKVAWRALALLERELLAAHPEMEPGKNVRNFSRVGEGFGRCGPGWRAFSDMIADAERMAVLAFGGLYSNDVLPDEIDDDPLDDLVLVEPPETRMLVPTPPARAFKVGDCVRIVAENIDGAVFLDDGDPEGQCPYHVRDANGLVGCYDEIDLELIERPNA